MLDDALLEALAPVLPERPTYREPPTPLSGGFYTENHAFQLDAALPWDGPLVVRLFPSEVETSMVRREAITQRYLARSGYATPDVRYFDEDSRLLGRHFFVMDRVPGAAMLDGISTRDLVGYAYRWINTVPELTARTQAALHAVDPAPLLTQLSTVETGTERWLSRLEQAIDDGAEGFADGVAWLRGNIPKPRAEAAICHGDLHPGNMIFEGRELTAVIDWTTVTIAEPAFDVGWAAMTFQLAPVDAPRPIQRIVARLGTGMTKRFTAAYVSETGVDLFNQRYYEALRCASELTAVVSHRLGRDVPLATWNSVADDMVDYFAARTGVRLVLPPPI